MSHGRFTWNLAELQAAMHLAERDVVDYFTDGRRVSFILERRLMREVLNGTLAKSEGDDYDVMDDQGRKWEVRSISKGGIYFCPSYMVGSGRRFEEAGFLKKLDAIHGFAVSDITQFPDIPYWLVESTTVRTWWEAALLGSTSSVTRTRALELLTGSVRA